MRHPVRNAFSTKNLVALGCVTALGTVAHSQPVANSPLATIDESAVLPQGVELTSNTALDEVSDVVDATAWLYTYRVSLAGKGNETKQEQERLTAISQAVRLEGGVARAGFETIAQEAGLDRFLRSDQVDVEFANWQTEQERYAELLAAEMETQEEEAFDLSQFDQQLDPNNQEDATPRSSQDVVDGLRLSYLMSPAEDRAPAPEPTHPQSQEASAPTFQPDVLSTASPMTRDDGDLPLVSAMPVYSLPSEESNTPAVSDGRARRQAPTPDRPPSADDRQESQERQAADRALVAHSAVFLTGDPAVDPSPQTRNDDPGNHRAGTVPSPARSLGRPIPFGGIASTPSSQSPEPSRGGSGFPSSFEFDPLPSPSIDPTNGQDEPADEPQPQPQPEPQPEPEPEPQSEPQPVAGPESALPAAFGPTSRQSPAAEALPQRADQTEPAAFESTLEPVLDGPAPEIKADTRTLTQSPAPVMTQGAQASVLGEPAELTLADEQPVAPIALRAATAAPIGLERESDAAAEFEAEALEGLEPDAEQPVANTVPLRRMRSAQALVEENEAAPELGRAARSTSPPVIASAHAATPLAYRLETAQDSTPSALVTFAPIPEPHSALALALLAPMLTIRRRR